MNIPENDGIVQSTLNIPEGDGLVSAPEAKPEQETSRLKAMAEGAFLGIESFRSTFAKAGAKAIQGLNKGFENIPILNKEIIPKQYINTPEDIQNQFIETKQIHDMNQNVQAHPGFDTLGQIGGSIAATAPIPGVLGAAKTIPGIVAGSAASGGLFGGLQNTPEQGTDIADIPGAISGAKIGALLSPLAMFGRAYQAKTNQLQAAREAAPGVRIFERDLPSNGIIDSGFNWLARNTVGKLPWYLGGDELYRGTQKQQVQEALTNFAQQATNTPKTYKQIENIVTNKINHLDNTEKTLWNNVTTKLSESGTKSIDTTNTKEAAKSLLNLATTVQQGTLVGGLNKNQLEFLKNISSSLPPGDLINLKRDTWKIYNQLAMNAKKPNSPTIVGEMRDLAEKTWLGTIKDINVGLKPDAPEALKAFEAANQFTKTYKQEIFNPKTNPEMIKAIESLSNDKMRFQQWTNKLLNPSVTSAYLNKNSTLLGKKGVDVLAQQQVSNVINKAMKIDEQGKTVVDLSRLLQGVDTLKGAPLQQFNKQQIEALSGLMTIAKQNLANNGGRNLVDSAPQLATAAGIGGTAFMQGVGLGTLGKAAIPVMAGLHAASYIGAHSPLKSSLIWLNKITQKGMPINKGLGNLIIQKVFDNLNKAGIIIKNNDDGSVTIDKSE